ncbi:hypothetical protein XELAEV_18006540mg, partial [Xenopus laevis]
QPSFSQVAPDAENREGLWPRQLSKLHCSCHFNHLSTGYTIQCIIHLQSMGEFNLPHFNFKTYIYSLFCFIYVRY